jgi:hypothetical protein
LVGCGRTKLARPASARELYTSTLFRLTLRYVERWADEVRIVSAFHHVVRPDARIIPYDRRIADLGGKTERHAWGDRCVTMLARELSTPGPWECVLFMGEEYAAPLRGHLRARGFTYREPLAGLGVGARMAWLRHSLAARQWG